MHLTLTKGLALAILGFSAIIHASPLDTRATKWIPGQSTCPSGDGLEYDGPKGGAWRIRCNVDTDDGGYNAAISPKGNVPFNTCIQTCGKYPDQCTRVSFNGDVNSGGACYLKGSSASALHSAQGVKVATKLNP